MESATRDAAALALAALLLTACSGPVVAAPPEEPVESAEDGRSAAPIGARVVAWPREGSGDVDALLDGSTAVAALLLESAPAAPATLVLQLSPAPAEVAAIGVHVAAPAVGETSVAVFSRTGLVPIEARSFPRFVESSVARGSASIADSGWTVLVPPDPFAAHFVWLQLGGAGIPSEVGLSEVRVFSVPELSALRASPDGIRFVALSEVDATGGAG
jgi:hypothetical protein